MRLWHQSLIHYLDNKRILGQHRECCALRGKGWGKKHSVVDYVFQYDLAHLYEYHMIVIDEMIVRGYKPDSAWIFRSYRGQSMQSVEPDEFGSYVWDKKSMIYPEHDSKYLKECLLNLQAKNVILVNGATIEKFMITADVGKEI